jgi:TolB-like protein
VAQKEKTKIAVVGFSDVKGHVTNFGVFLADELTTLLFKTGKFTVVERQQVKKLEEDDKAFRTSAIGDPTSASKLLTILDVNALVSGTITELSDSVHVNARLFGKNGKVFAAASADIVKDDSVMHLMGQSTASSSGYTSSDTSLERFEIGNRKSGSIIDGQHRDYEFDGVANSPLIFTIRVEECTPHNTGELLAGILDIRGGVQKRNTIILAAGKKCYSPRLQMVSM